VTALVVSFVIDRLNWSPGAGSNEHGPPYDVMMTTAPNSSRQARPAAAAA
jgi:hypothetical protein